MSNVYPFTSRPTAARAIDGKQPAHDLVAEGAVLATAMLRPELAKELFAVVAPRNFFSRAHEEIARAIVSVLERGELPDKTNVAIELNATGRMPIVGCAGDLVKLCDDAPAISSPKDYARRVQALYVQRELTHCLHEIAAESYEPTRDVGGLLAHAERTIAEVSRTLDDSSAVTILQVAKDLARSLTEPRTGVIETGFAELDRIILGLEPRRFFVVGGRPGMGKTALVQQFAASAGRAGHNVLFLSFEMPREQLFARMVSAEARVPLHAIRQRKLTPKQWSAFEFGASRLASLPITIIDRRLNVPQIGAAARSERAAVVFLDHVGLVPPQHRSTRTREQEVAEISRALKGLANELAIPIVALAQVGRDVAKGARRPQLSDLRESGSLEQDADCVVFVHRRAYYDPKAPEDVQREAELVVAKQRDGEQAVISVVWRGEFACFESSGATP
jgi:replicative DNA helicase